MKTKKRLSWALLSTWLALAGTVANASALVDPDLIAFGRGETGMQSVFVVAAMQAPGQEPQAPPRYDQVGVVQFLHARAAYSWNTVAQYLQNSGDLGSTVQPVVTHWINNTFVAEVTPEGLRALAQSPGIAKIYSNHGVYEEPVMAEGDFSEGDSGGLPYDFVEMGLDKLIKEMPQITGQGVVIGSVDTGVDGDHPALRGKILRFYDAKSGQLTQPYDEDRHGTHTAGTMVGGDRTHKPIGVAPGAKLVVAGALASYDSMLKAMEYMLDPDGDPSTPDMPRAINNSWNCGGAPDVELFYKAISAWEAAGILPVFSAGNSGRDGMRTITQPHEHPLAFAVGATGRDGKLADFSSRGPGQFHGQDTQKPDVTAPGVEINSSVPGGGYEKMDGTSMATPHVTGMVALMLQANPALTPAQQRQIIATTVTPMDADGNMGEAGGWNPYYGVGKVNAYRAVKAALEVGRAGLAWNPADLMGKFFTSPKSVFMNTFFAPPPRLDAKEFNYTQKPTGWVTVSALIKKAVSPKKGS